MAEHTAGPWEAFDDEIVAANTDVHIATVPLTDGINPSEWQANMRLIASAPDLLSALQDAVQTAQNYYALFHDETWKARVVKWEAAIQKAERP